MSLTQAPSETESQSLSLSPVPVCVWKLCVRWGCAALLVIPIERWWWRAVADVSHTKCIESELTMYLPCRRLHSIKCAVIFFPLLRFTSLWIWYNILFSIHTSIHTVVCSNIKSLVFHSVKSVRVWRWRWRRQQTAVACAGGGGGGSGGSSI